ncbi:cytochrome c-type biogenesis protein CcmH [Micromonospora sp. NPDC049559]|uniref:cytochrome c-type biogenesis protein CcmH n=1 Tax=Micromonospora sp. NPDC049559 TaxID=3155923 RepID=UPI00342B36CC
MTSRPRALTGAATARRFAAGLALAVLLLAAAAGLWRSARTESHTDPARRLAAELRCPACQGESVADSRSPIAAAMRDAIGGQFAQGRSPEQVRAYLVERYGPEVLAAPPARGPGLLLWAAPALALLAGAVPPAVRAARRARPVAGGTTADGATAAGTTAACATADGTTSAGARPAPERPGTGAGSSVRAGRSGASGRVWYAAAACLLVLVGGVAVARPYLPGRAGTGAATEPVAGRTGDPVADRLVLARSMEEQGRYDAAAEIYRDVLEQRPADEVRLRLAFTLIRSGEVDRAERLAAEVLAGRPDAPDALLMLGLARRAGGRRDAEEPLRRFLVLAPEHPAAPEVRRLLG